MSGSINNKAKEDESLDLTTIKAPIGSATKAGSGRGSAVDVGPPEDVGKTRKGIAYILLAMLGAIIAVELLYAMIYSGSCFIYPKSCADGASAYQLILDAIAPVFTAMIGLVGSVVGFYFGSKPD